MKKYSFSKEQLKVDEIKKHLNDRHTDAYIEDIILDLTGEKEFWEGKKKDDSGLNNVYFKPLVEMSYDDGAKLPFEEGWALLKYTNFPGKKIIKKELKSGRAYVLIDEGKVRLERSK